MNKKIYISGPITDTNDDYKARFKKYEDSINKMSGYEAINPAYTTLPTSAEHKDYMHVSFALIDLADAIIMTKGWESSEGCKQELQYAATRGINILFEEHAK